jgi:hypothetical protein
MDVMLRRRQARTAPTSPERLTRTRTHVHAAQLSGTMNDESRTASQTPTACVGDVLVGCGA